MMADTPVLTLALTGDVMLGRLMNNALIAEGPAHPWGDTLPLLRSADLTIINLECVISDRGRQWRRTPKVFHFRAIPLALDTLEAAGVDAVSLANNHVLDFEEAALLDMLERLEARGLAYAGAGRNEAEAARPAVLTTKGVRLELIGLTDNEPEWAASPIWPGTHYVPITTEDPVQRRLAACIVGARRQADFVIVSAHWGPNMVLRPPPRHRAFAHLVLDLGADLFIGHSAHLFQGVEWYDGKPIVYDAGDFVDDYAVDPELRNDWALLFLATVAPAARAAGATGSQVSGAVDGGASGAGDGGPSGAGDGGAPGARDGDASGAGNSGASGGGDRGAGWHVRQLELVPCLIDHFQVNQAHGEEHERIVRRALDLSAELGTRLDRAGTRLVTTPPAIPTR